MSNDADWTAEARRRIDAGLSVKQVARDLGRSADGVRYALNIGGAKDLKRKRVSASRLREKAERIGVKLKATGKRSKVLINEERSVASAYADKPEPARVVISLPAISLPDIEEPRLMIRIAPRSVAAVKPGVERIRQIHLSMKRRGLIPERSDLVDHFTH